MKNNQPQSSHGGARPNAGRKVGKVSKTTQEIADVAKAYGPDCIAGLWHLAQSSDSDAAKVSAIKEILDRAYGKSKQQVDATFNGTLTVLSKEQRDAAFAGALRADS